MLKKVFRLKIKEGSKRFLKSIVEKIFKLKRFISVSDFTVFI